MNWVSLVASFPQVRRCNTESAKVTRTASTTWTRPQGASPSFGPSTMSSSNRWAKSTLHTWKPWHKITTPTFYLRSLFLSSPIFLSCERLTAPSLFPAYRTFHTISASKSVLNVNITCLLQLHSPCLLSKWWNQSLPQHVCFARLCESNNYFVTAYSKDYVSHAILAMFSMLLESSTATAARNSYQ